jgi:hypothetical protein
MFYQGRERAVQRGAGLGYALVSRCALASRVIIGHR